MKYFSMFSGKRALNEVELRRYGQEKDKLEADVSMSIKQSDKRQSGMTVVLGLKEHTVHMGMFDFTIIVVTGDYGKLGKYFAWKIEDKDFDIDAFYEGYECRGRCLYKVGYVPIVWIPKKPRTATEHATFAHECIHAVFHLFEWAEIPISRDTEEVFAHAVAHIIKSVKFS